MSLPLTEDLAANNTVTGTAPEAEKGNPLPPSQFRVWRSCTLAEGTDCWIHGSPEADVLSKANRLLAAANSNGDDALKDWVTEELNLGAAILQTPRTTVGIVDCVASIPLFVGRRNGKADVTSAPGTLGTGDIDPRALRQLSMAGFTVGRRTLYRNVESLRSGELVIIENDKPRYLSATRYVSDPDPSIDADDPESQRRHSDLLLTLLEEMTRDAKGRTLYVPLSAGLDSRAILSGLKEVGYDSVVAFSYGLPGNHEAIGAKAVADRVGYPWHMVSYTHERQRAFFEGSEAAAFFEFANRPDAMPFMQDVPALSALRDMGLLEPDGILINGQSGDFIAGNHIPDALMHHTKTLLDCVLEKHFSLWDTLHMEAARENLAEDISAETADYPEAIAPAAAYELLEYESRQSRYVVAGQRAYEFFGYDWELPLWDPRYVAFWRQVPLQAKQARRLFRKSLERSNWAGVWTPDWVFPHHVVPKWLRPVRFACKAGFIANRDAWRSFDKRNFAWLMDPVLNYAIAPYGTVRRSRDGFRNALSWHCRAYLARNGIRFEDLKDLT